MNTFLDRIGQFELATVATVVGGAQQTKAIDACCRVAIVRASIGDILQVGERGNKRGVGVALDRRTEGQRRIERLGDLASGANVFICMYFGLVCNLGGRRETVVVVREHDGERLVTHDVRLALVASQTRIVAQRLQRIQHRCRVITVDLIAELDGTTSTIVIVPFTGMITVT